MQSYVKYKDSYDNKARASPLQQKDHCNINLKRTTRDQQPHAETSDGLVRV